MSKGTLHFCLLRCESCVTKQDCCEMMDHLTKSEVSKKDKAKVWGFKTFISLLKEKGLFGISNIRFLYLLARATRCKELSYSLELYEKGLSQSSSTYPVTCGNPYKPKSFRELLLILSSHMNNADFARVKLRLRCHQNIPCDHVSNNGILFKTLRKHGIASEDNLDALLDLFRKSSVDHLAEIVSKFKKKSTGKKESCLDNCNLGGIFTELSQHLRKKTRKAFMTKYGFSVVEKEDTTDNLDFFEKLKEKGIVHEGDISVLRLLAEKYIMPNGRAMKLINEYERKYIRDSTEGASSFKEEEEEEEDSASLSVTEPRSSFERLLVDLSTKISVYEMKGFMNNHELFSKREAFWTNEPSEFFDALKRKGLLSEDDVKVFRYFQRANPERGADIMSILDEYERSKRLKRFDSWTSEKRKVHTPTKHDFDKPICFDKKDDKMSRIISYMIETGSTTVLNMLNAIYVTHRGIDINLVKRSIAMDASADEELIQLYINLRIGMDAEVMVEAHKAGNTEFVGSCLPYMNLSEKLSFLFSVCDSPMTEATVMDYLREFYYVDARCARSLLQKYGWESIEFLQMIFVKLEGYIEMFVANPNCEELNEVIEIVMNVIEIVHVDTLEKIFMLSARVFYSHADILHCAIEKAIEGDCLSLFKKLLVARRVTDKEKLETTLISFIQKKSFPFVKALIESEHIEKVSLFWTVVIDCDYVELAEYFVNNGISPTVHQFQYYRDNKSRLSDEFISIMEDTIRANPALALELAKKMELRQEEKKALPPPEKPRGDDSEESGSNCMICLDDKKSVAVIPCLHVCFCVNCSKHENVLKLKECPMCRGKVERLSKVFF